jgi:hypothetical protein
MKSILGMGGGGGGGGGGNRGGPAGRSGAENNGENRNPNPNTNTSYDLQHRPPCVALGDGKRARDSPGKSGPEDKTARGEFFRLTDGAPLGSSCFRLTDGAPLGSSCSRCHQPPHLRLVAAPTHLNRVHRES